MAGIRILLVEDNPAIAAEIKASLEKLGYDVHPPFRNGKDAIKASYAHKPDLALVDARLKGRPNSIETGDSLRHAHQIPVIFIAEHIDDTTLEDIKTAALFGYIHHPFEKTDLKIAIEVALFRHRSERVLEENRRWFATALDSIGDGVIAAGRDGVITYMNPTAEAITLWKKKDAVGRRLEELGVTQHAETNEPVEVIGMKTLRNGLPEGDDARVFAFLDRNGLRKDILASSSPILSPSGVVEGVIIVIHDVTSRRIHERHHHSIEKMEVLGKLSSTVAHEFSTLFGVITGYASSLIASLASNTPAYEDAQKLLDAARHGQDLTRRILVIARASNAEGDIRLQTVSLRQTIRRAIENTHDTLARNQVEIKFQESEHMPSVMADPTQLVDVLMDFFYNAAEAMPAGGAIKVAVQDQMVKRPDVKANPKAASGPYAVIRITDSGCGIDPDVLERIFEPFFTTKKNRGVGLGLAVANSAILGYGGWIRVRSKVDEGTTFHLFIPIAAPKAAGVLHHDKAPLFLLIDHETDLLNETAAILKAEGFRVQTAETASDGLALYKKNPDAFSLCIVDAIMPDMETGEMTRKLLEAKPGTPLIITSGFSRDYMRRFMPHSEWAFIQKPVEREALLTAITRLLGDESEPRETPAP
jgi:PAS domain S-box-containing protein